MDIIQETSAAKPIAYSYVRFSTSKQQLGDSLRRQLEMTESYCERNGLTLHPVSFRDLGVSAFKKKNVEKGALAAFIDAVKTGKVLKGSYLIIEQFDRLSRADVDVAVRLLLDLVHSGISLVTLVDEKVWDRETVKDIGNLIIAIVFMSRANNESEAKAKRLKEVWKERRRRAAEEGKLITRGAPEWLRVNDDRTAFDVLEDRVESIRKVFELRIAGFGASAIVSRANKEKWPVPGKGDSWHNSLITRLLKSRALLGEYQPTRVIEVVGADGSSATRREPACDPIPHYYPVVIDEGLFLRAQAVSARRDRFPGRRDVGCRNFLQGLLKCSCGASFVRKNKHSAKQPGYARYYCTARNRGASNCPGLAAETVEAVVLNAVAHYAPQHFSGVARATELRNALELLAVDLSTAEQKRDRFADAIGTASASAVAALVERFEAAHEQVDTVKELIAITHAELADIEASASEDVFERILRCATVDDDVDARSELRESLSRILEKVIVDSAAKSLTLHFRGKSQVVKVSFDEEDIDDDVSVLTVSADEPFNE